MQNWYLYHGTGDEPQVLVTIYSLFACVFAVGMSIGVIVALSCLLFAQLKSVHRNKTNIEQYICDKADVRERDAPFVYPYDVGWRDNWRQVLWRTPDFREHMDGFHWPLRSDCHQFVFTVGLFSVSHTINLYSKNNSRRRRRSASRRAATCARRSTRAPSAVRRSCGVWPGAAACAASRWLTATDWRCASDSTWP